MVSDKEAVNQIVYHCVYRVIESNYGWFLEGEFNQFSKTL
jgi:hypothetical protein